VPDSDQRIGLGIRERFDKHSLHHAEDRRGGTDAEREGNQRDGGEQGSATQAAQHIARVMECPAELPSRLLLIALFAGALEPTKRNHGLAMGFLRRHSIGDVHARGLLQVKLQFVVEIDRAPARQEETQTREEFPQHSDP
jgi:hypothetical protein